MFNSYSILRLLAFEVLTGYFDQMVRVASYSAFQGDDEAPFHRYSNRGHVFAHGHDREYPSVPNHALYSGPRNHHPSPQEPRTVSHSPENDSNSRPRSRIPVAVSSPILDDKQHDL